MNGSAPGHPERPAPGGSRARRYHIETWGCQMNVLDTDKLAGTLESLGWSRAEGAGGADLVLLNTCAVREKATEKVFSELGRLRRLKEGRPDMLLGVTGCVAAMAGEEIFRRAPYVDLVVGSRGIRNLPSLVAAARARRRAIDVAHHQESVLFPYETIRRTGSPRAYVTVIEGCNMACTFCIVPTTRGPEASRPVEDVVAEVRDVARRGAAEVEFLGQTVNAYRDPEGRRLADLLEAAHAVDGIRRFRFTTSHPVHMSRRLMETMARLPRLVRHLHLPVQSGSTAVLRRMRRGYGREEYLDRIDRLRDLMPDLSFSTDLIVGFPGETEEDFRQTLELLDRVGFDTVYSFVFSPRPGTAAESLEDPVHFEEKAERLARLQERQRAIQARRMSSWIGRDVEVLIEGPARTGEGMLSGRSFHGQMVNLPGAGRSIGEIVRARVEAAGTFSLRAAAAEAHS